MTGLDGNHYEVLGVEPRASADQVERAYRFALGLYGEGSLATYSLLDPEEARAARARVEEAYAVLADPERRRAYDVRLGFVAAATVVPFPPQAGTLEPAAPPVRAGQPGPAAAGEDAAEDFAAGTPLGATPAVGPDVAAAEPSFAPASPAAAHAPVIPAAAEPPVTPQPPLAPPVPGAAGPVAPDIAVAAGPPVASDAPALPARSTPVEAPAQAPAAAPPAGPADAPVGPPIVLSGAVTGAVLRRVREERGVSLREISFRSKIGVRFLEYIEADRHDMLPALVYLRGFVMEYARLIGLDPRHTAQAYIARLPKP
jgi:hypothetical protein